MDTATREGLRDQLVDRRARIGVAITQTKDAADLVHLLQEIDSALARLDQGTYGRCEVCREEIADEFLLANPLIQYCLCGLTAEQQTALEHDLALATRIQWALLPKQDLQFAGWEAHFRYEPAGPVSGDYCDLITRQTDRQDLFFVVGDVSGKGVAASLLMAHLNAMFRSLIQVGLPVDQLVERANRLLSESKIPSHYATLVCGRAGESGQIEICNAGHCPPMVIRADGVSTIEATGFPVGMFASEPYGVQRTSLSVGETLFLYTDGLTEARDPGGTEYGVERLTRLLQQGHDLPSGLLGASCREDLSAFLSGRPSEDDLTILILRRTG